VTAVSDCSVAAGLLLEKDLLWQRLGNETVESKVPAPTSERRAVVLRSIASDTLVSCSN
jgi:hypothetical protein